MTKTTTNKLLNDRKALCENPGTTNSRRCLDIHRRISIIVVEFRKCRFSALLVIMVINKYIYTINNFILRLYINTRYV
jgi:hypothetical protein